MNDDVTLTADAVAARLVADLMPIAVAIHGPGAPQFAAAFAEAGAEAEVFPGPGGAAYDLAILLAPGSATGAADSEATVAALAAASDRLLFIPLQRAGAEPDLDAWFEALAGHGFQPVVDYDASFLGPGAFLVDRNATAADSDLADFAARVAAGGAPAEAPAPLTPAPPEDSSQRDAMRAELAQLSAALAASQAEAASARHEVEVLKRAMDAWQSLGSWVWTVCAAPGRDTLASLRAASGGIVGRYGPFARLRGRTSRPTKAERILLADAALVRTSRHFDAAWYIASHPELAENGGDPVWHYILRGAAAGAEPGPYFDSAPWRQTAPDRNPLAEAVRRGEG
jgi:hypothetical protein